MPNDAPNQFAPLSNTHLNPLAGLPDQEFDPSLTSLDSATVATLAFSRNATPNLNSPGSNWDPNHLLGIATFTPTPRLNWDGPVNTAVTTPVYPHPETPPSHIGTPVDTPAIVYHSTPTNAMVNVSETPFNLGFPLSCVTPHAQQPCGTKTFPVPSRSVGPARHPWQKPSSLSKPYIRPEQTNRAKGTIEDWNFLISPTSLSAPAAHSPPKNTHSLFPALEVQHDEAPMPSPPVVSPAPTSTPIPSAQPCAPGSTAAAKEANYPPCMPASTISASPLRAITPTASSTCDIATPITVETLRDTPMSSPKLYPPPGASDQHEPTHQNSQEPHVPTVHSPVPTPVLVDTAHHSPAPDRASSSPAVVDAQALQAITTPIMNQTKPSDLDPQHAPSPPIQCSEDEVTCEFAASLGFNLGDTGYQSVVRANSTSIDFSDSSDSSSQLCGAIDGKGKGKAKKRTPKPELLDGQWHGRTAGPLSWNAKPPNLNVNHVPKWSFSTTIPDLGDLVGCREGDIHIQQTGFEGTGTFCHWVCALSLWGTYEWVRYEPGQPHPQYREFVLRQASLPDRPARWMKDKSYKLLHVGARK